MKWWPWGEDKEVRCGSGPIFSTDWIWRSLHKLGLTRHSKDPFIDVCKYDDQLTDSKYKYSQMMENQEELERVEKMFDEVNKSVKHPRVAWFYKQVLRRIRGYFDRN